MPTWPSAYRNLLPNRHRMMEAGMGNPGISYYVDATGGSDANDGLAEDRAWQTIAKVNGETFEPGDRVRFKRGETWIERLIVPSSGVAGNPITFGAYGSGANPTIDGEDARWCISASSKSYIIIDGIDVTRSTSSGMYFDGTYSDVTIRNLSTTDNAGHGLIIDESPTGRINIINVTCTGNTLSGVRIDDAEDGGRIANCIITDNSDHGIEASNCIGFLVEGNEIGNNADGSGFGGDEFSYCTIQDNTIYNNRYGGVDLTGQAEACEYNIVRRNVFYNHTTLQYIGAVHAWTTDTVGHLSQYNQVYNNIFYNNNLAIMIDGRSQNNEYYHNTIYDAVFYGFFISTEGAGAVYPTNNTVKNNIMQDSGAYHVYSEIDEATNVFDNNCYDDEHANCFAWNDISYATFANWRTNSSQDANSELDNPDMVNPGAQDFHLQSVSPCRGEGATGTGVADDYDGVTRDSPPDIGAYEYVA